MAINFIFAHDERLLANAIIENQQPKLGEGTIYLKKDLSHCDLLDLKLLINQLQTTQSLSELDFKDDVSSLAMIEKTNGIQKEMIANQHGLSFYSDEHREILSTKFKQAFLISEKISNRYDVSILTQSLAQSTDDAFVSIPATQEYLEWNDTKLLNEMVLNYYQQRLSMQSFEKLKEAISAFNEIELKCLILNIQAKENLISIIKATEIKKELWGKSDLWPDQIKKLIHSDVFIERRIDKLMELDAIKAYKKSVFSQNPPSYIETEFMHCEDKQILIDYILSCMKNKIEDENYIKFAEELTNLSLAGLKILINDIHFEEATKNLSYQHYIENGKTCYRGSDGEIYQQYHENKRQTENEIFAQYHIKISSDEYISEVSKVLKCKEFTNK